MNAHTRRGIGDRLVAAGAIAVLAMPAFWEPTTASFFPPCLWRILTGWLCPGCGSARAIHALTHGNVGAAIHANPLVVASAPFVTIDLFRRLFGYGGVSTTQLRPAFIGAIAIVIVLFGVLRNVL